MAYVPNDVKIARAKQLKSLLTFEMLGTKVFKVHADGEIELLNRGIELKDALATLIGFTNMAVQRAQANGDKLTTC